MTNPRFETAGVSIDPRAARYEINIGSYQNLDSPLETGSKG